MDRLRDLFQSNALPIERYYSNWEASCGRKRHCVRVVKELVLKANGLCPREFESRRCRPFFVWGSADGPHQKTCFLEGFERAGLNHPAKNKPVVTAGIEPTTPTRNIAKIDFLRSIFAFFAFQPRRTLQIHPTQLWLIFILIKVTSETSKHQKKCIFDLSHFRPKKQVNSTC